MTAKQDPAPVSIVADTSVLINFLRIDRMDLIGRYPARFVATDHVAEEITEPVQLRRYRAAIYAGHLVEQRVDDPAEVQLFLRLGQTGRLGAGERSAIAVALHRGWRLAIEDRRAIRRAVGEAGIAGNPVAILRTQDIVVTLIRNGVLTLEEADAMRADWADRHRFRLNIRSFRDLLRP